MAGKRNSTDFQEKRRLQRTFDGRDSEARLSHRMHHIPLIQSITISNTCTHLLFILSKVLGYLKISIIFFQQNYFKQIPRPSYEINYELGTANITVRTSIEINILFKVMKNIPEVRRNVSLNRSNAPRPPQI